MLLIGRLPPPALSLPHVGPSSSPHSQPALKQVRGPVASRVNAVCPGPILTEGTQRHADSQGVSLEAACQDMIGRMVMPRWVMHTTPTPPWISLPCRWWRKCSQCALPACRMGRPEEVASCVAFLASSDASFMTGSAMTCDGGYSLE